MTFSKAVVTDGFRSKLDATDRGGLDRELDWLGPADGWL
jgi:hypothetical protein